MRRSYILCHVGYSLHDLTSLKFFLTDCRCGLGSLNGSCSASGTCYCHTGVMGAKCDGCSLLYELLSSSGCQRCSQCELSLYQSILSAVDLLFQTDGTLEMLQLKLQADTEAAALVEYMLGELLTRPNSLVAGLGALEESLATLNETLLQSYEFSQRSNTKVI